MPGRGSGFTVIGQTVSHYRILEKLGTGGMGIVYEAEDTKLRRRVALKFLSEELLSDDSAVHRFVREARSASSFNHPNICTIYEIEEHEGRPFMAMELLEGRTLKQRLQDGPLPVLSALEISIQVGNALTMAHSKGVIHRDIKPGNIFITSDGNVKILDFGLAKQASEELRHAAHDQDEQSLTRLGYIPGTTAYLSPEQARGDELDIRSDLFSFGVVIYEMVTGHRPFSKKSVILTLEAILNRHPASVLSFDPELPPELDAIIARTLEKDREKRYQSASQMITDLANLKHRLETGSGSQPIPAPVPVAAAAAPSRLESSERTITTIRRKRQLMVPLGIGLAVILVLAAVFVAHKLQGPAPAGSSKVMLAVLPFQNLSNDPGQEYFTDGLTEDLITELGRLHPDQLGVIARTTAMQYKNTDKSIQQIGDELGVQYVLEGSVRRSGDHVRVDARLMQARDQTQVWTDSFDRSMGDIISLQSELARSIAGGIRVEVSPEEEARLARTEKVNPAAYDAYVRGRHHWNQRTLDDLNLAFEYFQQAITLEPKYALAYAGMADVWLSLGFYYMAPEQAMPRAKEAARKALELDDNLAQAHNALAYCLFHYDFDFKGAEKEFLRAIELNNSYVTAHQWYGEYLAALGRSDEALERSRLAQELDPRSASVNSVAGLTSYLSHHYDQSIAEGVETLKLNPNFLPAHLFLGMAWEETGLSQNAIALLTRAVQLSGRSPIYLAELAHAYARAGNKQNAQVLLEELTAPSQPAYVSAYQVALIQAELGDLDRAFQYLNKAYQERSSWMVYVSVDPRFESLRSDPRFQDLLRRMKFPS